MFNFIFEFMKGRLNCKPRCYTKISISEMWFENHHFKGGVCKRCGLRLSQEIMDKLFEPKTKD